jgi:hypothetical protein
LDRCARTSMTAVVTSSASSSHRLTSNTAFPRVVTGSEGSGSGTASKRWLLTSTRRQSQTGDGGHWGRFQAPARTAGAAGWKEHASRLVAVLARLGGGGSGVTVPGPNLLNPPPPAHLEVRPQGYAAKSSGRAARAREDPAKDTEHPSSKN